MGDLADWAFDEAIRQEAEFDQDLDAWLEETDAVLRRETAAARSEKIKGIRSWPRPLSEKQRYCLARWIVENRTEP